MSDAQTPPPPLLPLLVLGVVGFTQTRPFDRLSLEGSTQVLCLPGIAETALLATLKELPGVVLTVPVPLEHREKVLGLLEGALSISCNTPPTCTPLPTAQVGEGA